MMYIYWELGIFYKILGNCFIFTESSLCHNADYDEFYIWLVGVESAKSMRMVFNNYGDNGTTVSIYQYS